MSLIQKLELDPILTAEIVHQGVNRFRNVTGEEDGKLRDVIWFLLEEAAQVNRIIRKPGPSQVSASWVPYHHTSAEIVGAYNEILAEIREAEKKERTPNEYFTPSSRPVPDAMAHKRYLEVMSWLRLITAKTRVGWKQRAMLILALADGMPHKRAMDVFKHEHLPSPKAVGMVRHRALNQMENGVRKACHRFALVA